jgi:hypothetical protein
MITTAALAVLALVLLGIVRGPLTSSPAPTDEAGDYYCVVIRDGQGRPVNTTCVPWPLG